MKTLSTLLIKFEVLKPLNDLELAFSRTTNARCLLELELLDIIEKSKRPIFRSKRATLLGEQAERAEGKGRDERGPVIQRQLANFSRGPVSPSFEF